MVQFSFLIFAFFYFGSSESGCYFFLSFHHFSQNFQKIHFASQIRKIKSGRIYEWYFGSIFLPIYMTVFYVCLETILKNLFHFSYIYTSRFSCIINLKTALKINWLKMPY